MTKIGVLLGLSKRHWHFIMLIFVGVFLQVLVVYQFIYPSNHLLPLASVDGISVGGLEKSKAVSELDKLYTKTIIPVYFVKTDKPHLYPNISDIGLSVQNSTRIQKNIYPWFLKFIPTSIFWAQFFSYNQTEPDYVYDDNVLNGYIVKNFGDTCVVNATNATLKYSGSGFQVVSSEAGGKCEVSAIKKTLLSIKPHLNKIGQIIIGSKKIEPEINDKTAKEFGDSIKTKVGSGVDISIEGESKTIPANNLLSWMDFSVKDKYLAYSFNSVRASAYLKKEIAPKVEIPATVTTVTTYDFYETSRVEGTYGRGLNIVETLNSIKSSIDNIGIKAVAVTKVVAPTVYYIRGYSTTDQGFSALMQQYADEHEGIKGVSFVELDGKHRRASYNDSNIYTSASTYKLYVAYSTLKRIESGTWSWSDNIFDDKDLATCFDDMIVQSDNDCAETLLEKIGNYEATVEAEEIGCTNTSFVTGTGYAKTSAGDLALFLAQLHSGQILNQQSSRDTLINAMKRNVYREGIPSGVSWEVANKVGFGEGILNDAAIVYSPTGAYVLTIMTDGADWSRIADLASEIEALRVK